MQAGHSNQKQQILAATKSIVLKAKSEHALL